MAGNEHERHGHGAPPPEVGHEERDVNAWAIGKFAIGLVVLCGLTLLLLAGLFKYFKGQEAANQPPPSEISIDTSRLPPEPRLETTPIQDLEAMRAAEDLALSSYGWVDQKASVVRIPIDRAIDLLAQRGLPARAQQQAATASEASVPTESGLGAKMQPPGGPLAGDVK